MRACAAVRMPPSSWDPGLGRTCAPDRTPRKTSTSVHRTLLMRMICKLGLTDCKAPRDSDRSKRNSGFKNKTERNNKKLKV